MSELLLMEPTKEIERAAMKYRDYYIEHALLYEKLIIKLWGPYRVWYMSFRASQRIMKCVA